MFDKYINYWMEQKIKAGKEGNQPMRQIAKLMLNSLYGKFGSRCKGKSKIPTLDENGIPADADERVRIAGKIIEEAAKYGNRIIRLKDGKII